MLSIQHVKKTFGMVQALADVSIEVNTGEVRALLGANGAGKSTLVKILSGVYQRDAGTILIDGKPISCASPSEAAKQGIVCVYQELSLVPGLTVAENITLGHWPIKRVAGIKMIDRPRMMEMAASVMKKLNAHIDLNAAVSDLSISFQQIVEIAKALSANPRILILDEPTSALPNDECDMLIRMVRSLAEQGMTIIYISHRMDEIPRVADTLTVLRDGHLIGTLPVAEAPTEKVVDMMMGMAVTARGADKNLLPPSDEVCLSVRNLSRGRYFRNVSFDLRKGEVLGIAGLMGSGRSELLRCIFGRDARQSGQIFVGGREVSKANERDMIARGVGLAPEDRRSSGLVLGHTVSDNLVMAAFSRFTRAGVTSDKKIRSLAMEAVKLLDIKTPSLDTCTENLSGGNQQKIVFGKWMTAQSWIWLLDEPTRGIDIMTKQQIYEEIRKFSSAGGSAVVVSSEMEELFEVSHRIMVLNHGNVVGILDADKTDIHEIMALAMKEFAV